MSIRCSYCLLSPCSCGEERYMEIPTMGEQIADLKQQLAAAQARIAELEEQIDLQIPKGVLVAQQARIAELREALEDWRLGILGVDKLQTLFANKDDHSALEAAKSQARRDALLEAAKLVRDKLAFRMSEGSPHRVWTHEVVDELRRMAGEVKP